MKFKNRLENGGENEHLQARFIDESGVGENVRREEK
jgi:hypothetical protein